MEVILMAEIKPFRALRFTEKAGAIKELCCPPYDIISADEQKAYKEKNPYNIIGLELPGKEAADYEAAANRQNSWIENEILKQDDKDTIYIYEEDFEVAGKRYSFRGIVCRVKLYHFSENVVLPHEETLNGAKEDRFRLMTATGSNFSQIYSLYHDDGSTAATVAENSSSAAEIEFTDGDGVTHRMWRITDDAEISKLCAQFADRKLYIADGHHRYETALRYRDSVGHAGASDYVMMFLINMDNSGLVVFPTHRIINGLDSFDTAAVLDGCREDFEVLAVEKADIQPMLDKKYAENKKAFGFYDGKNAYLLTLRDTAVMEKVLPNASKALRELDVSVLHSLLLERILKIDKENMANQKNLTYTRSADEAFAAAEAGADACFILNPTRVEEIAAVSQAGEKMPQKSTYFYPKLITGLVMNKIL